MKANATPLAWRETRTKARTVRRSKRNKYAVLYVMLLPAVLLTIVFNYIPMFSNVIAFMDYDMFDGWMGLGSDWSGIANFKSFLTDPWFYELAVRTLYYSVAMMVFSFPASLILALLLNEIRSQTFKKVVQTVSYIPHFVSWVTVAGLFYIFLSVDPSGLVNNVMGWLFGTERQVYMQNTAIFLPLLVISQVWKEIGWGSILYLAGISTIDPTLYEAAKVDGANRWKQMLHITLPGLKATTVILLIFSLAGLFGGNFDQLFNFQNQIIQDDTNIINTYTYYTGVRGHEYSLATAVGLFQGVIGFLLMMGANYTTKKLSDVGIV